jgi:hypothetical protein
LFLSFDQWFKHNTSVSAQDLPSELQLVYRVLDSFHRVNEDKADLSVYDLASLFFANPVKDKEFYTALFEQLDPLLPNAQATTTYIDSLKRNKLLREAALKAYDASEGKGSYVETLELFKTIVALPDGSTEALSADDFVSTKLSDLLNESYTKPGLTWRLDCLNKSLGSIRKNNFGFIFAFVETGKTSMLASETTFMFPQLQPDEYLHWYNNEQAGSEVMLRVYQAYFGIELSQLYSNVPHYERLFEEATQGRWIMKDSANISTSLVEKTCAKYKPGLIVFDQLDKIKGVGDKADRDDLRLGEKFRWAREIAKTYAPVIGVTQADANGAHKQWLAMDEVAGAKVAKQAEADWILGIGKSFKDGFENVRYLNVVKNKLAGDLGITDPKQRHSKHTVNIFPEISRYEDIK